MIASTELKNSLKGHAVRLSTIAGDHAEREKRERALVELRKAEQAELNSLTAFKSDFCATLKELMSIDWPTLSKAVNVGFPDGGTVEVEAKAILADLETGIKFHQEFSQDREPSDAAIERAVALRGLADRLRERVQALHDSVSKL
jgi:hypothetical protein